MYCKKCGKELADDFKICPYCMTPTDPPADPGNDGDPQNKTKKAVLIICAAVVIIALVAGAFILGKNHKDQDMSTTSSSAASLSSVSKKDTKSEKMTSSSKASQTTTTTAAANPVITPTDKDWEKFGKMINRMYINKFDCKTADTQDVFETIYFCAHMPVYEQIFGDIAYSYDDPAQFTISADNFNWIVKNVFNVEPKTVDSFTVDGEEVGRRKGGNYVIATNPMGYEYPELELKSKTENPDGTYSIVLNAYELSMEDDSRSFIGTVSATAELKETDGKRFWSIYTIN